MIKDYNGNLSPLKNLISKSTGLTFDSIREDMLLKEISKAISEKGLRSFDELFSILHSDKDALSDFVKDLTINETYFFREPKHLELFINRILPELMTQKKKPLEKIRILSAGCSTGEEPYTVAIMLMEKYGRHIQHMFEIIGLDIDTDALNKAKSGSFGKMSLRNTDQRLAEKYFESRADGRFSLKPFVRDTVEFDYHNLADDSCPACYFGMDIIFYRNVSIYFGRETQGKIFGKLASMLNEDGYILLSSTETMSHDLEIMEMVELDGLFLFKKTVPGPTHTKPSQNHPSRRISLAEHLSRMAAPKARPVNRAPRISPSPAADRQAAVTEDDYSAALKCFMQKEYGNALKLTDALMESEGRTARANLLRANVLFNMNMLDEAEQSCSEAVSVDELSLEGYLLLAMIAKCRQMPDAAMRWFHNALYVHPNCWTAHYYLGDIHELRGENTKALRHYRAARESLRSEEGRDRDLVFFKLSFQPEHLLFLLNKKIERLEGAANGV